MIFILKRPITPSQRHLIRTTRKHLRQKPLLKTQISGLLCRAGRSSNTGKITVRHKGGGHKRKYRHLDFKRNIDSEGIICSIEYDPNRSARIASVYDFNQKRFFYIILPLGLRLGDIVKAGFNIEPRVGCSLPLAKIQAGSYIHNVSINNTNISKIARAAGTFATLIEKSESLAKIKVSSGKLIFVPSYCFASIGVVSNEEAFLTKRGKAGQSRWLGQRPSVRGVAMNPVDHPNGGGEGKKSSKGKTPWGKK